MHQMNLKVVLCFSFVLIGLINEKYLSLFILYSVRAYSKFVMDYDHNDFKVLLMAR